MLLWSKWHREPLNKSPMLSSSSNRTILIMACDVRSKHLWCVTGTFIGDDFKDSYVLKIVLCPTDGFKMPSKKLCSPAVYVEELQWVAFTLRSITWRTMKIYAVNAELNPAPQIVEVKCTRFGLIEMYHCRSLELQTSLFRAARFHQNAGFMTYSRNALIALRQACCHPNIGAPGRRLLMTHAIRSHIAKRHDNIDPRNDKA